MPSIATMRERIETTLERPWLVSEDPAGAVDGYAHAASHRTRAAYQWSVDVSAYVRADARGRGTGKQLYHALIEMLASLGDHQAFAGIPLPNTASVALHESVGFVGIGRYRSVGFKHGAWHDVGWWQRSLAADTTPGEPPFRGGSGA